MALSKEHWCPSHLIIEPLYSFDVKDLKLYQQLYIYVIPIITNLGFINIFVVVARLVWFERRFKTAGMLVLLVVPVCGRELTLLAVSSLPQLDTLRDLEAQKVSGESKEANKADKADKADAGGEPYVVLRLIVPLSTALAADLALFSPSLRSNEATAEPEQAATVVPGTRITFDEHVKKPRENSTLYIPSPRERDDGTKLPLRADPGWCLD